MQLQNNSPKYFEDSLLGPRLVSRSELLQLQDEDLRGIVQVIAMLWLMDIQLSLSPVHNSG